MASPICALDFVIHPGNTSPSLTAIRATGVIENGDAERLQIFLNSQPKRKNTAVYLGSSGGSLYEGFRLGIFFHDNRIKTVLEGGMDCASACAIAFLGGTDDNDKAWRSSSTNSRLGFHAFKSGGDLNQDEIQSIAADMIQYGRYVNAPMEFIVVALQTPSDAIYWVSNA